MGAEKNYCEPEVVPQSWYCAVSQKCWWPPTSISNATVKKLIIKSAKYDESTWTSYDAECIATFSKYMYIVCNSWTYNNTHCNLETYGAAMKEIGNAILGKEIVSQKSSTDVDGTKRGKGKRKRMPSRKGRASWPATSSDSGEQQLSNNKTRERKQQTKAQSYGSGSSSSEIELEDAIGPHRTQRSRVIEMSSTNFGAINNCFTYFCRNQIVFFCFFLLLGSSAITISNGPTHSAEMVGLPQVPSSLGRQSLLTYEKESEPVASTSRHRGDCLYLKHLN